MAVRDFGMTLSNGMVMLIVIVLSGFVAMDSSCVETVIRILMMVIAILLLLYGKQEVLFS